MDLRLYIDRQRPWSLATFGPGRRTGGITKHIEKELAEIRAEPEILDEWCDIIILGLDGAWRTGHSAQEIADALVAKQRRNFERTWPRPVSEDEPVEHVREEAGK